jgi:hypothetical protein
MESQVQDAVASDQDMELSTGEATLILGALFAVVMCLFSFTTL